MTRNDHKTRFTQLLNRMEARFVGGVYKALRGQYLKVIHDIKNYGIDHARANLNHQIMNHAMQPAVLKIYKDAGRYMAGRTLSGLNKHNRISLNGQKEPNKQIQIALNTKYNTFGYNDEWVRDIVNFFQMYLLEKAVIKVSNTTRDKILAVLAEATEEGWSNDQIVQALSNLDEIRGRARMIVRTETVRAANYGVLLGADKYDFETEKQWLAIEDNRTRHSHRTVDGQAREMDDKFSNGLRFPGDPEGGASEVINCRCTLLVNAKRDQRGRLIPKERSRQMVAA
jgi:SPP1 gp7 family putative phage head morphogenesis protein